MIMTEKKKVVIVGAGASGMMAAIAAARNGASVTVLEAMERPGRKLLLTGNGRCNITNTDPKLPSMYYGSGSLHASSIIPQMDAGAVCKLFEELGLLTMQKNGYVYPYTGQASSVLEVLLTELQRLKVKLKYNEKVEELLRQEDNSWLVRTATWQYPADAVIMACGSCAAPLTGSDGSGYQIAEQAGYQVNTPAPALVSLCCEEHFLPALAGVRSRAAVSLYDVSGNQLLRKESGELQWTKYGVSGIVIFQLSRFVSVQKVKNPAAVFQLYVDLFPDVESEMLFHLIQSRCRQLSDAPLRLLLCGILNEKLIPAVMERVFSGDTDHKAKTKQAKAKNKKEKQILCNQITDLQIEALADCMKNFKLTVTDTKSFDTAQVCAGGVDASQLDTQTMESLLHRNLYFVGELVDTDGPCGGFNLQWAWSSGWVAGTAAAKQEDLCS